jgi:ribose transport system permease protein
VENTGTLNIFERMLGGRTVMVFVALGLFVVVAGLLAPASLGLDNVQSVIRESSFLGIVALGQGVVMLSGGLDISVGNIMFFVIVYGGNFLSGHPGYFALLCVLCVLVGALVGLINGIGVSRFKISPIIMTLATSSMLYGLVYIFGGDKLGKASPEPLQFVGKGVFFGVVPYTGVIWLVLAGSFAFVLYRTTFGRRIYATGNNPKTAWLSGIDSEGTLIKSYIICGALAAFAGLLLLGYLGTPTLRFTDIYTMGSIEAAVLGGIDFFAGVGSIVGTVAGSLLVRFMFTILLMLRVPDAGRMIAEGALILLIVAGYKLRER